MASIPWLLGAVLLCSCFVIPSNSIKPLCPRGCICMRRAVRCMHAKLDAVPFVPHDTNLLDLRLNNIHFIPIGSLSNLRHLTTLLLSNNYLTVLPDDQFKGLKKLKVLYLYRNKIHQIENGAFNDLENLEQLYLHDNKIESLNREALSNLPSLQRLFLHNNRLKRLPHNIFNNMPRLERLRLDSNYLVCDCSLVWLMKMTSKRRYTRSTFQMAAECNSPEEMAGMSVMSINEKDLNCESPQIVKQPEDLEFNFGGSAIFACDVIGNPQPEIIWMHDSEKISPTNVRYEVFDNGTLKITNPDESDSGYFECMAINDMGEVHSKPAKMVVKRQTNEELRFTVTPASLKVKEGNKFLTLDCKAAGQPNPHISWYHDKHKLLLSENVKMVHNGSIIINKVTPSDAGKYTCHASNIYSTIHASADIEILSLPRVVESPTSVSVQIGSQAKFYCSAEAVPEPTNTWFKNGESLISTSKVHISDDSKKLQIIHVEYEDAGTYLCRSSNSEGFIENSANLNIVLAEETAPLIVYKPLDTEAFPGSLIELPCKAEANPTPFIEWKKDGSILSRTSRYKITPIGSLHVLNVTLQDSGRYECSAFNKYGRVSASALLKVHDPTNNLGNDELIRLALSQATADIDDAINKTIDNLFSNKKKYIDFGELFRASRFPNEPAREIARSAEIYERTLVNIRKYINAGKNITAANAFSYEDILSPKQLDLVAKLSGCMVHQKINKCSDVCFHKKYRSNDGSCNNLKHPMYGASSTGFRRIKEPIYENGFSTPVGWTKGMLYNGFVLPSARLISTSLISTKKITSDTIITHMVMQWGQFLDHDLDHATPSVSSQSWDGIDCKKSCEYAAPCFPMDVPPGDPRINNRRCIDFIRSSSICGSGMTSVIFGKVQPREQINQLTSYIDASQVYGFSEELANDLRDFRNNDGILRKGVEFPGSKPLLPYAGNQGVDCRRDPLESNVNCFVAGDIRANEQVGLLAMHTLWFREHNRIAEELIEVNPHWDGDTLYYEARKIVGAQMQHITYSQWLPVIIGPSGMEILGKYQSYNDSINPSISNVFATAALRFGHSLINPVLHRLDYDFNPISQGHLPLHKAFFSPWRLVDEGGIDPLLRGLFSVPAKLKTPSQNLNSELTEKLFHNAHAVALDLAAMNIQRSRDHAIPPYTEWRKFCKMTPVNTFADLKNEISDKNIRDKLKQLYGSPSNIDVWVGGILEDQLPGAKVGPLFQCLLIEQFARLRDGDRFWYENPSTLKPNQLLEIKQTTLSRVLCDNGDNITRVTKDVFKLPHLQGGMVNCDTIPSIDLSQWADCGDCESTNKENNSLRSRRSIQTKIQNDIIFELQNKIKHLTDKVLELEKQMRKFSFLSNSKNNV